MLRTHAPAAALLARRSTPKGVSRRNFACSSLSSSSPARWRRCSAGGAHRTSGPLICGTGRPLPPPPARPSPLPLLRPPPRLRRRRPAAPTCACALSAQTSREAHAPHAGLPGLPNACHPPERAQDEKAQAGGRRRSPGRRRHTAGPHRHLRSRPRPTRSLTAQPYPTAPSTHLAAVRLLARPTHA